MLRLRPDAQVTITTTTVEDAATVIAEAVATTTVIVTQTIQNQSHATQTNVIVQLHNSVMTLSVGQSKKFC